MAAIHELITKVIPLKGILRTPSYWMRKVLMAIADAVEAVKTELRNADSKLQSNIDATKTELTNADKSLQLEKVNLDYNLDESSVILRNSKCIIKLTGTALVDGGVRVVVSSGTTSVTILGVKYTPTNNVVYAWIDKGKTSLTGMFNRAYDSIVSIELPSIDTSAVTDMSHMFNSCSGLTSLDVSNFDTSAVTSMLYMFIGCSGLTSLDVSNFDTSAVTSMVGMFDHCSGLTSLDLSNFNTSAVTSMYGMFIGCSGLTSLDLSNFDTSAVTDMGVMFGDCSGLTSLDLSNFDTSAVTSMGSMFSGCTALKNIKCKQAFKDWCVANKSIINLTVENITWEIVQ